MKLPVFYNRSAVPSADAVFPEHVAFPALTLRRYENLAVYPRHVLVSRDSFGVCPISFKKHRYQEHGGLLHWGNDLYSLRAEFLQPLLRKVEGPCYFGDTEYPGIYGHDLLEVVTAAWAWKHMKCGSKFITSTRKSRHLLALLNAAGVSENDLLFFDEPLRVDELYFPEPAVKLRKYMHPAAHELLWSVGDRLYRPELCTPERIYISRSRVAERPLTNEAEIEELFREHGFAILHCQDMPIEDQITAFRNARWIAGPGGSGMHNAVFSRPDSRILILSSAGWLTVADTLIDHGLSRLGYAMGTPSNFDGKRTREPWSISKAEVCLAIQQHFTD